MADRLLTVGLLTYWLTLCGAVTGLQSWPRLREWLADSENPVPGLIIVLGSGAVAAVAMWRSHSPGPRARGFAGGLAVIAAAAVGTPIAFLWWNWTMLTGYLASMAILVAAWETCRRAVPQNSAGAFGARWLRRFGLPAHGCFAALFSFLMSTLATDIRLWEDRKSSRLETLWQLPALAWLAAIIVSMAVTVIMYWRWRERDSTRIESGAAPYV